MAESSAVSEYAVKFALLFKLPNFVYRTSGVEKPVYSICVIGTNPFGSALEKLSQKPVDGSLTKVMHLSASSNVSECDLVFIARSESLSLNATLRRFSNSATLTVSDIAGFAEAGGMVELGLGSKGSTVSIVLNRGVARRQQLDFNAQLLRLARVIE